MHFTKHRPSLCIREEVGWRKPFRPPLYVDDMLIVRQDMNKISSLKKALGKSFAMKNMGSAKQILGVYIVQDKTKKFLWFSQEKYVTKVPQRFNKQDVNPVGSTLSTNYKLNRNRCSKKKTKKAEMNKIPYALEVRSLMYAMVCTRADIAYAVRGLSRFMSNTGREHWTAIKWIFQYLKDTSSVCLGFGSSDHVLEGFTDSDMSHDDDISLSTSRYMMIFLVVREYREKVTT